MTHRRLVLASASPRRKELLGSLGIPFEISPSSVDETGFVESLGHAGPSQIVTALAEEKARQIAGQLSGDAIVIGADTVVVLDSHILGKPDNTEHAVEMLLTLSGRTHQVYTGLSLVSAAGSAISNVRTSFSVTDVEFAPFDEARARAYVATGEPLDKAGAYGIQALGALLIPRIHGDYFNVVGLPLHLLGQMLEEIGWPLL